ncbi:MAG: WG repeat-containing protein [Leptospiraceae bacterium]|nr:WG repeat-containing protein [Leptospiraceae bacterium]
MIVKLFLLLTILNSILAQDNIKITEVIDNHKKEFYIIKNNDQKIKIKELSSSNKKEVYKFNDFHEGLAQFYFDTIYSDEGGFIDTNGDVVFFFNDGPYSDFQEGLAVKFQTTYWNKKVNFIDKTGKKVLTDYYGAREYSHGLAPVSKVGKLKLKALDDVPIYTNLKWGYINKNNKFIIKPQYDDAKPFSKEGVAFVKKHGRWKEIMDKGEKVFDLLVEGKWGIINSKGNLIKNYIYNDVGDFSDGLAPVLIGGKEKIRLEYIGPNGHPYAEIYFKNGKWGYINSKAELKIKPIFEEAGNFENGYAFVKLKGKEFKIDKSGSVVQ